MEDTDRPDGLARGTLIGRHVVLEQIGSGGMGQVYRAYDPQLDRSIAIKILHAKPTGGESDTEGRARLMREAQAIARLSHPNVVVVYDFGEFGQGVFIAMEYVEGSTIRHWLNSNLGSQSSGRKRQPSKAGSVESESRDWREVLGVFLQAGEGLSAAHKAGIVHRDFKPDNVMLGKDGNVRVMDFGLARRTDIIAEVLGEVSSRHRVSLPAALKESGENGADLINTRNVSYAGGVAYLEPSRPSNLVNSRPFDIPLTVDGALVGTLWYMAPEQFAGETGDEKSDQFGFCAALYEGLYGKAPFWGGGAMEVSIRASDGRIPEAPAGTKVPNWLRKILLRGLSRFPEDRYPSMDALLVDLRNDPTVPRRRRQRLLGATAAVLILVGAVGTIAHRAGGQPPCRGAADKLVGIWEPGALRSARRHKIRAAFAATGKGYAGQTFETVSRLLDRYASSWITLHTSVCEATSVRKEQSEEVLDLRMSCLQDDLTSVKALTDIFEDADSEVVAKATSAVDSLGSLDRCSDLAALRAVVKPPSDPSTRARVDALRPRLARVKALTDAGHVADALLLARPEAEEARSIGYLPLLAEALGYLAKISRDQPAKAEAIYADAMWAAQAGGDDESYAELAILQSYVIGYLQGDAIRARQLTQSADAILHRMGGHYLLRSWLLNNEGTLYYIEGRYEESVSAEKKALALKRKVLGPDDSDIAQTLGNVADPLAKLGRIEEALDFNSRAIAIYEKTVGSEHPDLAMHLSTRGELLNSLHHYVEAEAPARRAVEIWERELGPRNLFLAAPLDVIGLSFIGRGMRAEATPFLERAYTLRRDLNAEPELRAESAFTLAQNMGRGESDAQRARILVEEARHLFDKAHNKEKLRETELWLSGHRHTQAPTGHPMGLNGGAVLPGSGL